MAILTTLGEVEYEEGIAPTNTVPVVCRFYFIFV